MTARADDDSPDDATGRDATGGDVASDGSAADVVGDRTAADAEPSGAQRSGGRIELVAEPVRYRRTPLVGLVIAAVVPAIGLVAFARWADSEADEYEAGRDAAEEFDDPIPEVDATTDEGPDVRLGTSLFDYRRTPDAVATIASARRLAAEVTPLFGFLGPQSCATFSIDGMPVAGHNADVAVIPASTQKLIVAAVALDVLGPDHRFTTSVAVPTPVDGEISGDIYLVGGGDPLLTSNDFPIEEDVQPAFATTSLDVLADAVAATGVMRIRGSVIGDGTRYDDEFAVPEWAEGIAGVDAGPYDALLANDGRVLGLSSLGSDPNESAARELVRLLDARGVRVDNGWGSGVRSTLVPVVGSVDSEPLSAVVAEMLTTSDNNTAEMLVKEIGAVVEGNGSRIVGLAVVRDTLAAWGVDVDTLTLVDGSGLSTGNRLTCTALSIVLQRFRGTALDDALPVAGRTGTLADEFVESPMLGRLRAKTGTLSNEPFDADPPAAKALAGYVDAEGAGTIEFTLLVNSSDVSLPTRYQPLWSAMGERLATYPAGPGPALLGPTER